MCFVKYFSFRLLESHKRVQRVNQSLEDKLLLLVDKTESEKNLLNSEITIISQKLVDQQFQVNQLNDENVSYNVKILLTIIRKLVNILNKSTHI